jgi:hypothetical protein
MGTIYILSNPCYKHPETNEPLYKIGMSSMSGEDRIKSLDSKTAVPMPFEIVEAFECDNPQKIEKCLHRVFDRDRINPDREFFTTDPDLVIDLLTEIGNLKIAERSDMDIVAPPDPTDKFFAVVEKYDAKAADDLKTAESRRFDRRRIMPFSDYNKRYFLSRMSNDFQFGFWYRIDYRISVSNINIARDNVAEYLKKLDGSKIDEFSFKYEERTANKQPYLSVDCPYSKDEAGLKAFIEFIERTKPDIDAITDKTTLGNEEENVQDVASSRSL